MITPDAEPRQVAFQVQDSLFIDICVSYVQLLEASMDFQIRKRFGVEWIECNIQRLQTRHTLEITEACACDLVHVQIQHQNIKLPQVLKILIRHILI